MRFWKNIVSILLVAGAICSSHVNAQQTGFSLCNPQLHTYESFYYPMIYEGGHQAIVAHFMHNYTVPAHAENETGFLRIRFLVNCKGEMGKFEVEGMTSNYVLKEFPASISDQLLRLTSQLHGWVHVTDGKTPLDFRKFLVFKIVDGKLLEVTP